MSPRGSRNSSRRLPRASRVSSLQPVPAAVVYDINVLVTAAAAVTARSGPGLHRRLYPATPRLTAWASSLTPPSSRSGCPRTSSPASTGSWPSCSNGPSRRSTLTCAPIVIAAEHSGGGIVADVPRTVHDCPDHEDNLILDLAAEVGALLVVSNDTDLLSMSPWRGTPIIEPTAFAAKVDAMRRHARRRRR